MPMTRRLMLMFGLMNARDGGGATDHRLCTLLFSLFKSSYSWGEAILDLRCQTKVPDFGSDKGMLIPLAKWTLTASCDINTAIRNGGRSILGNVKKNVARLEVAMNDALAVNMLYAKENAKKNTNTDRGVEAMLNATVPELANFLSIDIIGLVVP